MGKRRRRIRVLKECNRSQRVSKIIGRALAGVIDPQAVDLAPSENLFCQELGKATEEISRAILGAGLTDAMPHRPWLTLKPV